MAVIFSPEGLFSSMERRLERLAICGRDLERQMARTEEEEERPHAQERRSIS